MGGDDERDVDGELVSIAERALDESIDPSGLAERALAVLGGGTLADAGGVDLPNDRLATLPLDVEADGMRLPIRPLLSLGLRPRPSPETWPEDLGSRLGMRLP